MPSANGDIYVSAQSTSTSGGLVTPPDATSKAAPPPQLPFKQRPGADPTREYVSGFASLLISRFIESLPHYVDDLTRDFGADIYERMMNDSQVFSAVHILKAAILADGFQAVPCIQDEDDPRYETAKEYSEFCQRNTDNLENTFFEAFLYEMLDGIILGHKVAEQILRPDQEGQDKGKHVLKTLKTKPRGTYSFVVDAHMNVLGILGLIPGRGSPIHVGQVIDDPTKLPNFLPREKFAVFSYNQKNGDPRGNSGLRPAYDPWWIKQQTKREYVKYLALYSTPSLWGTTPEGATAEPILDELGNATGDPLQTPQERLLEQLQAVSAGSAGAFPFGTVIDSIPVSSDAGQPHREAILLLNREITKAILWQILATEEGQHMARAAQEGHRDIFDLGVRYARLLVGSVVKRDIYYNLIRINYGDAAARELTPNCEAGSADVPDWPTIAAAAVQLLQSGLLDENQAAAVLIKRLGLPPRKDKAPILGRLDAKMDLEIETQKRLASSDVDGGVAGNGNGSGKGGDKDKNGNKNKNGDKNKKADFSIDGADRGAISAEDLDEAAAWIGATVRDLRGP